MTLASIVAEIGITKSLEILRDIIDAVNDLFNKGPIEVTAEIDIRLAECKLALTNLSSVHEKQQRKLARAVPPSE